MSGKGKKRRALRKPKTKYVTPRLTVHGDLRALTRAKAGTKTDGGGKPATRDTGPQA